MERVKGWGRGEGYLLNRLRLGKKKSSRDRRYGEGRREEQIGAASLNIACNSWTFISLNPLYFQQPQPQQFNQTPLLTSSVGHYFNNGYQTGFPLGKVYFCTHKSSRCPPLTGNLSQVMCPKVNSTASWL